MQTQSPLPLTDVAVVITRPAGHGRALAADVRRLGGRAVLLPGLSLRPAPDADRARAALVTAYAGDFVLFSSPSAVQYAARLAPLRGVARFAAVGRGTARALRHYGVVEPVVSQSTQDAAGLLAHPALAAVDGAQVAVIGAPGGRGVLQAGMRERGARVSEVNVYQRVAARLDRRHREALDALTTERCVLLSSAAALRNLQRALSGQWHSLTAGVAIVSSPRMQMAAASAGFDRVVRARSALGADMLTCVVDVFGKRL